jgi:KDO2-lipid IV(A) lauroyltransferase
MATIRRGDSHCQSAGSLVGPIEPVRDAAGKIEVEGTMQIIAGIFEGWIREHPEQWLWLHRLWG